MLTKRNTFDIIIKRSESFAKSVNAIGLWKWRECRNMGFCFELKCWRIVDYKSAALPAELHQHEKIVPSGFSTPLLRIKRSNCLKPPSGGFCHRQLSCQRHFIFSGKRDRKIGRWKNWILESLTGIEPAHPAWKAGVLPLNYNDICGRVRDTTSPLVQSFPANIPSVRHMFTFIPAIPLYSKVHPVKDPW